MAIKLYVDGDETEALPKIVDALKKAGIKYQTITTVTAEAFLSKVKNHPDKVQLSPKVIESLTIVGKYDPRVREALAQKADAIEKALQEQLAFVKSLKG